MAPAKAPFNAAAFFAGKDRLARLGMLVALVALVVAGLAVTLALSSARQKVLFVVLDPGQRESGIVVRFKPPTRQSSP